MSEQFIFPTHHDENWKYTRTDELLTHQFSLDEQGQGISFGEVPQGVLVIPLREVGVSSHAALVTTYLGQIVSEKHGFHAQNRALYNQGFLIYIPKGVQADTPLYLQHHAKNQGKMQCIRHLIIAEEGSAIKMVESYESELQDPYFTNVLTEIVVGRGAFVSHLKIQREGVAAFHFGELGVRQLANSRFESHCVSLGAKWARNDMSIFFTEPHASCYMNGIYTPSANQHVDHHTAVFHDVPHCASEQDYKGIIKDKACAVFNGKVCVSEQGKHTEAKQYNKNLLLSAEAQVNTKPELQIDTDDVVCAHGATVGQLDEEALFYLMTRGLDTALARRYLMQAFLANNLSRMVAAGLGAKHSALIIDDYLEVAAC